MKIFQGVPRRGSGFTLLEIVVVLSIMMLMIGIGVAAFKITENDDPFEEPEAKLRQMAKLALQNATIQRRGQTIGFDKEGFSLLGSTEGGGGGEHYTVPKGMKVLILRLRGKAWEKAEGHFWGFGELGICEPIKVRFQTVEDYRELAFHPLTATPIEY